MSANYAQVTIVGNVGREPELKYLPSGAMVVEFSVAVNRKRGQAEATNWYRVSAFGKLAETLDKLTEQGALVKGKSVLVAGQLLAREFTGKDGKTGASLDVDADAVQLLGAKGERETSGAPGADVPF